MSKTIDERVVEMRFDNKNFESNVATSMSTLDKLKQKLKLDGATKGLENLSSAAKNNNIESLGNAADKVGLRFNAMYTIADQVLRNITTRVQQTAESMVKALTLDPITTGFQEYETQINAVQTILANTSSKGTTIDDVNAALDELNHYADLTIYNFTEMTRNIGTFTAAGVDLDTSVSAIQGIANLAAVSGSTSQQASTAMYQLSQALAAGTVKLMDWNSVVNAGMGGEVFQNALKETSELLGTGAEAAIEAKGSFRESLSTGWLTAEVLTKTLEKFTTSGANEYVAEYTGLSVDAVEAALEAAEAQYGEADAIDKASEALAKKSGKNKDEIKSILEMAKTATDAATKVKTFSQLWDVLKEAAQSGWSKTWQIIIGDFEEAKALLTPLSDFLTEIINRASDFRNNILEIALNFAEPWKNISEKISTVTEAVSNATDKLEYFQDIVNKVWRGDYNNWGDNPDRRDLLKAAGYDDRVVQDLVNKGYQYKLTIEDVEASHKKFGLTLEGTTEETQSAADAMAGLSDEQLKQAGLTEDEISLYRALEKEADRLGMSVSDLADEMSNNNGRTLLIDSFKNIGETILEVGEVAKEAWVEIFNPPGVGEIAVKLYGAIKSLNDFTKNLSLTDAETGELNETGKKLRSTFEGLFAVLDIVRTLVGGGLSIAFKVLSAVLDAFDLNILDVTASIGDSLVAFRDWLFEHNALSQAINGLIDKLPGFIAQIKEWFDAFKETPAVQKLVDAINAIREAFTKLTSGDISLSEFASSLGENLAKAVTSLPGIALQIGKDFIAGFQNGIDFSVSDVISKIVEFCLSFVDGFKEALGVQSPSWKAYETATDFFQGFINGASAIIGTVVSVLKGIGEKIVEVFKGLWDYLTDESGNIQWDKIIAGGIVIAMVVILKKFVDVLGIFADGIQGINGVLSAASNVLNGFTKTLNAVAWDLKAQAMLKMAGAIAILVACIWALTQIDDVAKLWNAVGVIAVLAAIVVALAFAMSKMSTVSIELSKNVKGLKASGIQQSILQIGLTILALAYAVKLIGTLDAEQAKQGFIGLAGVAAGLVIFMAAMGGISRYSGDANSLGKMMLKIAVAMGVMVLVMKMVSKMDPEDIVIGIAVMEAFVLLVAQMGIANRIAGGAGDKFGSNVLKISIAMGIMALVMKVIAGMDPDDILTGVATLQAFVILIGEMAIINRLAGSNGSKFGSAVMGMSASMLILTGVIWLLSKMDKSAVENGIQVMQLFVLVIAELVAISRLAGKEAPKIAANIIAMSMAIAILAGVAIVLSLIDTASLVKGIAAVGMLGLIMAAMIAATKGTQDVKGNLIVMVVAIGIMTAAVVALSYIDGVDLAGAVAALDSLMICFALMIAATSKAKNAKKILGTLAAMIGVTIVLAGLVVLLAQLDPKKAVPNALALSALMIAFAAAFKIMNGVKINKSVKNSLLIMAGVVAILAIILGIMAGLNVQASIPNALAIGILLNLMATAFRILDGVKINKSVKNSLLIMSGVIAILAIILGIMAGLNVQASIPNALAIGILLNLMATAFRILDGVKINESVKNSLLIMSGVVAILAIILGIMAGLNVQASIPNALAIGILLNLMATAFRILDGVKINESVKNSLLLMSGCMAILAIVLGVMSLFPNASTMIPNAIALGILVNAMAVAFKILDGVKINESVKSSLLIMSGCMAILALVLGVLSLFPNASVMIPNAIALGILINALAAALLIASFAGNNAAGAASAMIVMAVALGAVALVLGIMAAFNITPSIETALALSTLMIALSAACLICSLIPAGGGISGALALAEFIGIMAAVITAAGALAQIPGFQELLADGGTVLSLVGQAIGGFVGGIIAGVAGAVIDLIPQLGLALSVFAVSVQPFITLVGGLDASILASVGYLTGAILALTAASFLSGIANIMSLGQASLSNLGAELYLFGMYASIFYAAISGVDSGAVEAATNTANMILALTASELLSTITEKFGGSVDFSTLGQNLVTFGEAVVDFSDTISGKVDTEAVEAATNAGALLVELNKSLPRSGGLLQDLIGKQDFGEFAESCKAFAACILEINEAVSQEGFEVQSDKIQQLVDAGAAFNKLQTSLPKKGGKLQEFLGTQELEPFGTACVAFVACMIVINQSISSEDFVVQSDKLQQLADAGTAFSDLQNSLPKKEGKVQEFLGSEDLGSFGQAVAAFAACMIAVNAAISQEGFAVNLQGMEDLKQAGEKMNDLQSALPVDGGWWQEVAGSQDIGDFGEKIKSFAEAIVDFSTSSTELNMPGIDNCISVAYRLKRFVESLEGFSTEGVDTFTGIGTGGFGADGPAYRIAQAIAKFSDTVAEIDTSRVTVAVTAAKQLKTLINGLVNLDTSGVEKFKPGDIGDQMQNFSDKVSGIDTGKVSSSISSANRLKNFISGLSDLDTSGINKFKPKTIGSALSAYSTSVSGFNADDANSSISVARQLKSFISSLAGLDSTGASTFKTAINELSTANIEEMVEAFSSASDKLSKSGIDMVNGLVKGMQSNLPAVKSVTTRVISSAISEIRNAIPKFESAGNTMVSRMAGGLSSNKSVLSAAVTSCISRAASTIRAYYSSFYSAGSYLVSGFANGISANSYKAAAKAKAMANAAATAARNALDINSPSKVFEKIGSYVPAGFANGIDKMTTMVKDSSVAMANTALDGTKQAIANIAEMMSTDADYQPTITPVLDLSDVESGAGSIASMFNSSPSVGVNGNLRAIGSMMNQNSQNGMSDEIVSAINNLRKDLGNVGNTTYSINGVTYDDGSNIQDAVSAIVRQARIGRRV